MPIDFSNPITGSQQTDTLGTKPVAPGTGLTFDNPITEGVGLPYTPRGGESSISKRYGRLTGPIVPALGEEYYQRLAAGEQSGIEQFGAFLNQAIIGEIIGGTIEGLGYLGDLRQYHDLAAGEEEDFGNWFSDIGKGLRTWTEEATPIYTDPNQKKFAPGHWSWWMQNGKSVASTLSLLLPAVGAVKALGYLGKVAGISERVLAATKTMGLSSEAVNWAATGISRAVVSRHMESLMEASNNMESVEQDMLALGMSPQEAHEKGARAGANTYKYNWAMLLQDIPEYLVLGKYTGKISGSMTAKLAKELNLPLTPVLAKKWGGIGFNLLSEGFEEGYQFVVGEESRHLARVLSDPEYAGKVTFGERLGSYLKDGELWTNFAMGTLGAGAALIAAKGMGAISDKLAKNKPLTPEEQRLKNLYDFGALFSQANSILTKAKEVGDKDGIDKATTVLIGYMARKAAMTGGMQDVKTFISNILGDSYTPEQLQKYNMSPEDVEFVKQNFGNRVKDLDIFEQLVNKYTSGTKPLRVDDAARIAQSEFTLGKAKDKVVETKTRLNEVKSKVPSYNDTSILGQELYGHYGHGRSINTLIQLLQKRVDNAKTQNLSGEEIEKDKDDIAYYTSVFDTISKEYVAAVKDYKKSEDKKEDDAKGIDVIGTLRAAKIKDKDNEASPLYDIVKAQRSLDFSELEVKRSQEAFDADIRAYKRDSFERGATAESRMAGVHTDYRTQYDDILNSILNTNLLSDNIKDRIREYIGKGVHPMALLTPTFTPNADVTENILNSIKSDRKLTAELSTLGNNYLGDLFYSATGFKRADIPRDELEAVQNIIQTKLAEELNKNYILEAEEETYAFPAEPVQPKKPTVDQVTGATTDLNSADQATVAEDVLYADPFVLAGTISELLPMGINYAKVVYKGQKGIIEKLRGGQRYTFTSEDVKSPYTFDASELRQSIKDLGVYPIKYQIYSINNELNDITVGGKTYSLPINNLFNTIEEDKNGNPVAITFISRGNKAYRFINPILVTEIVTYLEELNAGRLSVYEDFREKNIEHLVIVTDSDTGIEYAVYNKGDEWIVYDKRKDLQGVVPKGAIQRRVLNKLYTELDSLIGYKGEERDEYRANIKGIRKPTSTEINTFPSTSAIPSPEGVKAKKRKFHDKGREEKYGPEDKSNEQTVINKKAQEIAGNKATNLQTAPIEPSVPVPPSTDGNIPPQEPGGEVIEPVRSGGKVVNLRNLAKSAPDLNKYLENPKNTLQGDRIEFFIDYEGGDNTDLEQGAKNYWKDKQDLRSRINKKDKSVYAIVDEEDKFDSIADNIPIRTRYITKEGKEFTGYYLPVSSDMKVMETARTVEELKNADTFYLQQKKQIRAERVSVLKKILKGQTPYSNVLVKNAGIYNNIGGRNNVEKTLGQPLSEIVMGYSTDDNVIVYSDGRISMEISTTAGNVFVVTKDTCDNSSKTIKLNPVKLSEEHANIVLKAYEALATDTATKPLYPRGQDNVKSIDINKQTHYVQAQAVLNILVNNGDQTNVDNYERLKPYLVPKQLFTKEGKLYYGDYRTGGTAGGVIDLNKITKEQRRAFVQYATANINYAVSAHMFNTKYGRTITIGSITIEPHFTSIMHVINNNLVTTDVGRAENGTLFVHPWVGFGVNSIKEGKVTIEPVTPLVAEPATVKIIEQVDKVQPTVLTKLTKSEDFYNLKKDDVIRYAESSNKEILLGNVKEDDKGLYIDIQSNLISLENKYPEKLYLSDKSGLKGLVDELINLYSSGGYIPYFTVSNIPVTPVIPKIEGKKSVEEKLDDLEGEGALFRAVDPKVKVEKINIQEEVEKVKKMLSGVFDKPDIRLVEKVIKVARQGREAWGAFTTDAVLIYKGAAAGTAYHEAFHHVSLMYLSEEERKLIYREARNRYNIKPEASAREVNEVLAEKFREYMMSNRVAEAEPRNIGNFFRELVRFIVTFITGRTRVSNLSIDKLFRAIEKGEFREARARRSNVIKYKGEIYLSEKGFTPTQVESIVNTMLYQAFKRSKITYAEDIPNLKLDSVLDYFNERRSAYLQLQTEAKEQKRSEETIKKLDSRVEVYDSIIRNSAFFMDVLKGKLLTEGIKEKINYADDGAEYISEDQYSQDFEVSKERYGMSVFEFNEADNVLSNIKFYVRTTPISNDVEPLTGLPIFADFNTLWNKMMYDLWKFDDIYDMIEYMEKKAETDIFYDRLVNGIKDKQNNVVRVGLKDAPERILSQFNRSFNKFRYNFLTLIVNTPNNPTYVPVESSSLREVRKIMNSWGAGFKYSKLFVKNSNVIYKKGVYTVSDVYNKLHEDMRSAYNKSGHTIDNLYSYVNRVVKLFNFIGINITDVTLLAYLNKIMEETPTITTPDEAMLSLFQRDYYRRKPNLGDVFEYNPGARQKSLLTYMYQGEKIHNAAGEEVSYVNSLKNKQVVKDLSMMYARANIDSLSNIVFGPDGNMYYNYAQNSYATDFVKRLNNPKKREQALKELEDDIYNGTKLPDGTYDSYSLFVQQLKEGANVELITYSSFNNTKYVELIPHDDFIFKFHVMMNDIIPFPTLAEKPTYHMFKGFKRLNLEDATFGEYGKRILPEYIFPENVYSTIIKYIRAETVRIRKAKKDVDLAESTGNYQYMRKNYHYQELDGKGIPILKVGDKYIGNAIRYLHFPIMNSQEINRVQMGELLNSRVLDTIKYAETLGIIRIFYGLDGKTVLNIENNSLDRGLVIRATEKYGSEMKAIMHLLADYTINTIVANIESEKLLSKDIAFYKDDIDKAKRLSELVAPGEALRENFHTGEYVGKTTYPVTTIQTQKYTSELSKKEGILYKKFEEEIRKLDPELSEPDLENAVIAILGSYSEIDPTDGTIWITPEFHKELSVRMGQWSDEMDDAFEILMSGREDLTLEEDMRLNKIVMQPLKYVYYGVTNENGLGIPVYDKMSFATLFPRQVKGTKVEDLYNWMIKNKLSMVKFDSAVKVGDTKPVVYFNPDGTTNKAALDDAIITYQHIRNLRLQQITDPFPTNETLLATQVKKILSDRVEEVSKVLTALSDKGVEEVKRILGVDKFGNVDNAKLFGEILHDNSVMRKMPHDVTNALKVDENGDPYLAIDSFFDNKWIESMLINTVAKKTIRPNVPGNVYSQVTSFGLDNIVGSDKLRMIDEAGSTEVIVSINLFKDAIPNYKNLTFNEARSWVMKNKARLEGLMYRIPTQGPNMVSAFVIKDVLPEYTGNTILVPFEFVALTESDFDIDKLNLFIYNYYTDKEGVAHTVPFFEGDENGDINSEDTLKKIHSQIYGRKQRLLESLKRAMEVAKFRSSFSEEMAKNLSEGEIRDLKEQLETQLAELLPNWGIKNVQPHDVQRVIDSLELEVIDLDAFILANKGKNAYQVNGKKALENKLLSIFIEYLTDEDHFYDTKAPLKHYVDKTKKLAKYIHDKEGGEKKKLFLESVSPVFQHETKILYTMSKAGMAPFALNIVHHSLGMHVGLGFRDYMGIGNKAEHGGTDLAKKNGGDKRSIFSWMSSMVSANVDAPKDPYVFYLNVNSVTWNMANLLLRAGMGDSTFYFLSQPILKDYVLSGGNYFTTSDKYMKRMTTLKGEELIDNETLIHKYSQPVDIFNNKQLVRNIDINTKRSLGWYARQVAILREYMRLNKFASKLGRVVQYSQVDTGRYGNTLTQIRLFEDGLNEMLTDESIINADKLFTDTFLGTYKENSIDLIHKLFSKLTIGSSLGFVELLKRITKEVGVTNMVSSKSQGVVNRITKELLFAIKSRYFNTAKGYNQTPKTVANILKGDDSVENIIYKIKHSEDRGDYEGLQNNFFINYLIPYREDEFDLGFLESPIIDTRDPFIRERLINGFTEMLQSDNKNVRLLAKKLFAYAFYTSGFSRTIFSFNHAIPHEYLKDAPTELGNDGVGVSYDKFVRETLAIFNNRILAEELQEVLRKELYINNWNDDALVPRINTNREVDNHKIATKGQVIIFTATDKNLVLGLNRKGQYVFKPYVKKIEDDGKIDLFEYIGYRMVTEKNKPVPKPVYKYVDKKGFVSNDRNHKIKEYGLEGKSIIESNNTNFVIEDHVKLLSTMRENKPVFPAYANMVYISGEDQELVLLDTDILNRDIPTIEEVEKELGFAPEVTPVPVAKPVMTEGVVNPNINFIEDESAFYPSRTRKNASADATIALAVNYETPGEAATEKAVKDQHKEYIGQPLPRDISVIKPISDLAVKMAVDRLNKVNAKTLNIAGNGIYTLNEYGYTQQLIDDMVYEYLNKVVNHPDLNNKIESIVTGGQTGVDEAGAKAGAKLGIPTTIRAPKNWMFRDINNEDIRNEQLFKSRFNISEEEYPFVSDEELKQKGLIIGEYTGPITSEEVLAELREKYRHCK